MADISRVRVELTGPAVIGPSVTTLHTTGAPGALMSAWSLLLIAFKPNSPSTLTWTFPSSGEVIDSTTGLATGTWTATPPPSIVGSDNGSYAAGVGERIVWGTDTFHAGRRIKGSTYIVPLGAGAYATDGRLNATMRGTQQTAVNTFVTAMSGAFCILTRRSARNPIGGLAAVTSGTVPNSVSWLRSRRT